jgi:hypothetical protein
MMEHRKVLFAKFFHNMGFSRNNRVEEISGRKVRM